MRLTYALIIGLIVFAAADRAAALSCYLPSDTLDQASPFDDSSLRIATDARPWHVVSCGGGDDLDETCALFLAPAGRDEPPPDPELPDGPSISVTVERLGQEVCDLDSDELELEHRAYIRRFTPAQPLEPGVTYRLQCGFERLYLSVRADSEPSAPPAEPLITAVRYTRGDDSGCCGGEGDRIELRLANMDPAYLRDGGHLEAAYLNGHRHVLVHPEGDEEDDHFELPPSDDIIELTPVAANGTRGPTVPIDPAEIDRDLVYIPCNVAGRGSAGAPWLLAAFLWICVAGRRQRRAA